MIAGKLGSHHKYLCTSPGLDKAFAYLERASVDLPEPGRHEIDSDRVFAIVSRYTTAPREERTLEGHYRYLDVQYLAAGGPEAIPHADAERAPVSEDYDPASDLVKYDKGSADSTIVLDQGDFAVFFPEDAHMPGVAHGQPAEVVKIVVKVRLA